MIGPKLGEAWPDSMPNVDSGIFTPAPTAEQQMRISALWMAIGNLGATAAVADLVPLAEQYYAYMAYGPMSSKPEDAQPETATT